MTRPTSTKHALRLLLDEVANDPVLAVRVKELIAKLPTPVPAGYLVEFEETLPGGGLAPKSQLVLDKPEGEYLDCSTEVYAGISHVDKADVEGLLRAAREVMSYIEASHRPPVRDEFEHGRMVLVRLHALASLREALLAFDDQPAVEETPVPTGEQSQAGEPARTFSLEELNQSMKDLGMQGHYAGNVQLMIAIKAGQTVRIDLEENPDHAVTIIPPTK
jgi:hypothetical protein